MINDLNGEKIIGTFYVKECQKNKSKRIEKLNIKRKQAICQMERI